MTVLLVAVGGAAGAVLRFLVDAGVQRRHGSGFPVGTLVVNVIGSLLLGFLAGAALVGVHVPVLRSLLGVGLCGALTTYSTFGHETVRMLLDGAYPRALTNIAVTVLSGLGAGVLGAVLAGAIWA